ncbi:membrane or secreted protein [Pontibacter beigongshangensis]|uniref:membrane or secreted protein n=1 Tax=Pontibacter beigongshangensis TaxID=2574733 RepID=UPI001F50BF0A|nr:membrane or secreted protein [Pontibacter beigongshangensis]
MPVKKMLCLCLVLLMGFTMPEKETVATPDNLLTTQQSTKAATALEGAWKLSNRTGNNGKATAGETAVKLVADGFFSVAIYDKEQKNFKGTYGGTYTVENGRLIEKFEFNTLDSTAVGNTVTSSYKLQKNSLQQNSGAGTTETWEKIPAGNDQTPLTGAWRINGRETKEGQMGTITPGPRKTIKMLAGNRFQWIAFNSETAGFFGTGGGTYTTRNGKYTENIEFFSRDSSRVGQQLTFDYDLKEGDWHHSGLSSTGNKINEIWQRLSKSGRRQEAK